MKNDQSVVSRISDQLRTIVATNATLSEYHQGRQQTLTRE